MAQTELNPTTVGAVGRVRGASLEGSHPLSNTTVAHGKAWLEVAANRLRRCHGLTYPRIRARLLTDGQWYVITGRAAATIMLLVSKGAIGLRPRGDALAALTVLLGKGGVQAA